jgi:hypothetical protein
MIIQQKSLKSIRSCKKKKTFEFVYAYNLQLYTEEYDRISICHWYIMIVGTWLLSNRFHSLKIDVQIGFRNVMRPTCRLVLVPIRYRMFQWWIANDYYIVHYIILYNDNIWEIRYNIIYVLNTRLTLKRA